jgi:hypothetical protein
MSDRTTFLEFCAKVRNRNNYPSGKPLRIRTLSENEATKLADALLAGTNITYLELEMAKCTKYSAEAMAKYVRSSKCLQRLRF